MRKRLYEHTLTQEEKTMVRTRLGAIHIHALVAKTRPLCIWSSSPSELNGIVAEVRGKLIEMEVI
jgi:hypothetical protein